MTFRENKSRITQVNNPTRLSFKALSGIAMNGVRAGVQAAGGLNQWFLNFGMADSLFVCCGVNSAWDTSFWIAFPPLGSGGAEVVLRQVRAAYSRM